MTIISLPLHPLSLVHRLAGLRIWRARRATAASPLSLREIEEAVRDTGLSPDDLLGLCQDGTEPFFFRQGFGEGRR